MSRVSTCLHTPTMQHLARAGRILGCLSALAGALLLLRDLIITGTVLLGLGLLMALAGWTHKLPTAPPKTPSDVKHFLKSPRQITLQWAFSEENLPAKGMAWLRCLVDQNQHTSNQDATRLFKLLHDNEEYLNNFARMIYSSCKENIKKKYVSLLWNKSQIQKLQQIPCLFNKLNELDIQSHLQKLQHYENRISELDLSLDLTKENISYAEFGYWLSMEGTAKEKAIAVLAQYIAKVAIHEGDELPSTEKEEEPSFYPAILCDVSFYPAISQALSHQEPMIKENFLDTFHNNMPRLRWNDWMDTLWLDTEQDLFWEHLKKEPYAARLAQQRMQEPGWSASAKEKVDAIVCNHKQQRVRTSQPLHEMSS